MEENKWRKIWVDFIVMGFLGAGCKSSSSLLLTGIARNIDPTYFLEQRLRPDKAGVSRVKICHPRQESYLRICRCFMKVFDLWVSLGCLQLLREGLARDEDAGDFFVYGILPPK